MKNKMKAAVKTAQGDFEVKDVERPAILKPDWALARVRQRVFVARTYDTRRKKSPN